jgi:hypothetical protein
MRKKGEIMAFAISHHQPMFRRKKINLTKALTSASVRQVNADLLRLPQEDSPADMCVCTNTLTSYISTHKYRYNFLSVFLFFFFFGCMLLLFKSFFGLLGESKQLRRAL